MSMTHAAEELVQAIMAPWVKWWAWATAASPAAHEAALPPLTNAQLDAAGEWARGVFQNAPPLMSSAEFAEAAHHAFALPEWFRKRLEEAP